MNKHAATSLLKHSPRPGLAHGVQAVAALLWLVQAAWIARAVGAMAAQMPGWDHRVMQAAVVVLAAGIAKAVLEAWAARCIYRQARQALAALRAQVTQALCGQSPLDKHRPSSGEAASMLAEQAEAVVPWLSRYLPAQFRVMLVTPAIALAVAWFSWTAALILLVAAPMIPLFMAIVGWRAQAASEAQMVESGRLSGFLLDRLRGLSTLRAVGAVEATAEQVLHTGLELKTRTMRVLRIAFLSSAVLELFSALGVAMVAVYVGFHLLGKLPFGAWGGRLTLAEGLFILMLAPAFFEPLRDLSAAWHDRASGRAALDNLRRLCECSTAAVGTQGRADTVLPAVAPQAHAGMALEIGNLGFAHADGSVVFDGFDLRVAAGRHVALVGGSGSGKSILLALVAGLLPAQRGRIVLDGVTLDDGSADALRSQMAWMGQKPHIFTGTVQDNIFLGRPTASAPQLQQTLQATGIAAALERLPVHILGEGGMGLSGGEAARLALARLAAQPQARLILLDEPTAHLDAATARQVMAAIKMLAQGRTLLVSTHDPLLLAQMDECVLVDAPTGAGGRMRQAPSASAVDVQEAQPA